MMLFLLGSFLYASQVPRDQAAIIPLLRCIVPAHLVRRGRARSQVLLHPIKVPPDLLRCHWADLASYCGKCHMQPFLRP